MTKLIRADRAMGYLAEHLVIRRNPSIRNLIIGLVAFTLVLSVVKIAICAYPVAAQDFETWAPQERIPDYGDESRPPYMVADTNRTIHVFNYQPIGLDDPTEAIFYRTWTLEDGWSAPNDILLSPMGGRPNLQDVFLDESGIIHLIFFGGNEVKGAMYYASAPAAAAGRAPAWTRPENIGENAGPLPSATMTSDGKGNIVVIYTGREDQEYGLYEVHSTDNGDTWSDPTLIMRTYDQLLPTGTRATFDEEGRVHVVWSLVDNRGIDVEIYYAKLSSDFAEWTEPYLFAQRTPKDYKTAWPTITSYDGALTVVYMQGSPATKWIRRSFDGGETWSDPERPFPHTGEYEHVVLVKDSNDTLHILLGNRLGDEAHGMWHGVWLGQRWSSLEPVVTGPKTLEFDPSAPRGVVSQGNLLFVAWWTDTGGAPRNGAWYSYKTIDAPELPIIPLPTPVVSPTPTPIPTKKAGLVEPKQETTPAKLNHQFDDVPAPAQSASPTFPIIVGIVSSLLIAVFVIVSQKFY
ncbi:MAG: hypothetical protein KDI62_07260 [Anaerolineae bacterium]|nr:hypothetical protein [Anaerolineae bacterium]MCB9107497.1 hypothetical protein [Anaerolineales bacterium]